MSVSLRKYSHPPSTFRGTSVRQLFHSSSAEVSKTHLASFELDGDDVPQGFVQQLDGHAEVGHDCWSACIAPSLLCRDKDSNPSRVAIEDCGGVLVVQY